MLEHLADALRHLWGLWLMLIFAGIIFWAFRPRNKDRFEKYGAIPLRDDQDEERNNGGHS
ncbi:CcoQ/FixQ family Cbb3-type cytochrome c oxidase assembly chaperone [Rhodospirillum rubrum]|nr:hypothetical protein F11_17070 [Rhodospirillum rubrum F11]MBK1664509.1 CcoQ/FixQ family Cbb3-type cytochrome c oxidase assembly chaperone [Rhodospirillum rubrum]MBK1676236.1 CcoQ/FixQ family Cbb3-type cytochrome c oxidase assembly chaperone [Rhodospirillum rubrum]MBK5955838.1 CcoQ/FixQ family Cbb3-type cytochrome c oxidase assembly chaperone [Rhodospirillum rubrum]